MNFFEFESKETIDDEFDLRLNVEPVGERYKYSVIFENTHTRFEYTGNANNPISALTKLRNIIVASIDSLSDAIDITKSAAAHVNAYFDEISNNEDVEEEDENDETTI